MEPQALDWMHGAENTWHGFLRLHDESSIALVCNPAIGAIPPVLGVIHAGKPGANSAPGTLRRLALEVRDQGERTWPRPRDGLNGTADSA